MKNYSKNRQGNVFVSLAVFGAILLIVSIGSFIMMKSNQADQMSMTKKNIERAIVQSYALEGQYAPTLEYLEENYGVVVNHDMYVVSYDAVAGNIRPQVSVVRREKR